MAQKNDTGRTCAIEQLESRRLLSGNVTATIVDGNLSILGDDVANDIIVSQGQLPDGQLRITSGTNATTINGEVGPVILDGFTGDLFVSLQRGPDKLTVRNITLPGDLTVQTGLGADTVTLSRVTVEGNTDIRTGVRADSVVIDDSTFNGSTTIKTKWGADKVNIDRSGSENGVRSVFRGAVDIQLNRGDDRLRIGRSEVAGNRAVFFSAVTCNGGIDYDDRIVRSNNNRFDVVPTIENFEGVEIGSVLV